MFDLYEEISKVDSCEIRPILEAVIDRYNKLFPDWEIFTISLERLSDKNKQLDSIIELLQKMKTQS